MVHRCLITIQLPVTRLSSKSKLHAHSLKRLLTGLLKFQVATINAEIVDSASSLGSVTHFFFGLTNEWLDSLAVKAVEAGATTPAAKMDTVPIHINGKSERFTLSKLSKMLVAAMPKAQRVKVLKMSKKATTKQYLNNMKQ